MIKVAPEETKTAVVRKKRTAPPSVKPDAGGAQVPPRAPVVAAASGENRKYIPVTVSLDQPLIDRLDDWAHKNRKTRSDAARVLLEKGLGKP